MSLFAALQLGLLVSMLFCVVVLTLKVLLALRFGRKPTYAHPQGSSFAGVLYALGQGMLPWEKETASKHIWTYMGGTLYHVGIMTATLLLVSVLFSISLPAKVLNLVRMSLVLGVVGGVGLLIKRIFQPHMRLLSDADDYLANILVNLLLLSALTATFAENLLVGFVAVAIIVFIYIPFGKIRHCVFFFYSRVLFGDFFGKRGVLPHPSRKT